MLGTCSLALNLWRGLTCGDLLAIHPPRLAAILALKLAALLRADYARYPRELVPGLPPAPPRSYRYRT